MPIPRVKTGPTAGQERSRNNNGRWRKKRNDTWIIRGNTDSLKTIVSAVSIIGMAINGIVKVINKFKNK